MSHPTPIQVACRLLPTVCSPACLVLASPSTLQVPTHRSSFEFDLIFPPSASQEEVFEALGRPLVADVLKGYNGTLFAYGQTGSGKTYTMYGTEDCPGLVPRTAEAVFEAVERQASEVEVSIKCAMMEIYKEQLRDLLDLSASQALKIKETPCEGVYVEGLRSEWVTSPYELTQVIEAALLTRVVSATHQNAHSSRSHLLCILAIEQKLQNGTLQTGTFNLIDLAGSEKLRSFDPLSPSIEETKKINYSLSVLGQVISALSNQAKHVPFRDSKLTRVLQESLGGNCKTTLVACCAGAEMWVEDTLSTLKFAERVRGIRNRVKVNTKQSAATYESIICDLQ